MKGELIFILLIILIIITKQDCIDKLNQQLSILLKGNGKNVLSSRSGALISSKLSNKFINENNGSCLRDNVYTLAVPYEAPYTYSQNGNKIIIQLMQQYLLNTLKIWFWDFNDFYNYPTRYYEIIVFAKSGIEIKKIYESRATSITTIEFPNQFVQEFQVYQPGIQIKIQNQKYYNGDFHILKIEAANNLSLKL